MTEESKEELKPDSTSGSEVSRRRFFSIVSWGSFFAAIGIMFWGSVRSLFPNVLYEPPSKFKGGPPDDYPIGSPSLPHFFADERVFIDRDQDGIFAISAVCTHLGCTVDWVEKEEKFKCPCHGAIFLRDGKNIEGPAPRPLPRFLVDISRDSRIIVDKAKEVNKEFRLKV